MAATRCLQGLFSLPTTQPLPLLNAPPTHSHCPATHPTSQTHRCPRASRSRTQMFTNSLGQQWWWQRAVPPRPRSTIRCPSAAGTPLLLTTWRKCLAAASPGTTWPACSVSAGMGWRDSWVSAEQGLAVAVCSSIQPFAVPLPQEKLALNGVAHCPPAPLPRSDQRLLARGAGGPLWCPRAGCVQRWGTCWHKWRLFA